MTTDTGTALSIQQPWAWLITHGHKPVENRRWRTHVRGRFLIHAGRQVDTDAAELLRSGRHPVTGEPLSLDLPEAWETGGLVGEAVIHGCVTRLADPYFVGPFGFLLREARPLPFLPCRGKLGFFVPTHADAPAPKREPASPPDLFTPSVPEVRQ